MPNMLWSRYRGHASSEEFALRRHSSVDCTQLERRNEHAIVNHHSDSQSTAQAPTKSSDLRHSSLEQLPAVDIPLVSRRSPSPVVQEPLLRPQRFSLFRSRNASDSQLSKTAKNQESAASPPMLTAPSIITTAPTMDQFDIAQKRKLTFSHLRRRKTPDPLKSLSSVPSRISLSEKTLVSGPESASSDPGNRSARMSRITFDEPERHRVAGAPPAYGDDVNSLALPNSRVSESSRSDGSYGENGVYATTTTTHTVSTTTTFFRLPRRKKNKGPLFPLPDKVPSQDHLARPSFASHGSMSGRASASPSRQSPSRTPPMTAIYRPFYSHRGDDGIPSHFPSPSNSALAASSTIFAAPGLPAPRSDSTPSARSGRSSLVLTPPILGRSSTKGSLRRAGNDEPLATPPLLEPSRASTSTAGRASLGGLFGLSRLRHNSEPQYPRHVFGSVGAHDTPASNRSKSNSLNLARESVVVPQREEGDTPAKYLARLEEAVTRGVVATIISKSDDDFSRNVLRSYMRGFNFFGYPLDMSIRKLLMEIELPKETQQIDRVLQAFANRYHECNPGVYASPDEAHFIAFSILILHTDVFNKNNKHKMQKNDYTKNAQGQGVAEEILECFYDNISYTPFIHVEDDLDINGERIVPQRARKTAFAKGSPDTLRKPSREPVDPYTLILDDKLESLRPSLKDVMSLDDPYNYLGTSTSLNLADLHQTFFKSGILQILSSRSRPEAFMSPETMANPAEAHPGVVDIKVTKVGILWRKDMKKKKARSPWQEWGALLTGSQLYFFRNTNWIRNLMHQYESHHKLGLGGTPVTFKPPLDHFKPDVLMSTEDAVALLDTSYKKHKHAFVFVRHGGFEETFLAENETETNDWLAKLNYASAFRSAGVRIRGLIGGNYDGQRTRGMRRMDSSNSSQSVQTASGEVLIRSGKIDAELARQIQTARRQIMVQKIAEAEEKLEAANKQLEAHLRNARHLQILAPIQNKTRERVLLAAGGMAAKIKWLRMEMWRTQCHKDILALDLDEETKSANDRKLRNDEIRATAPDSQASNLSNPESTSRRGSTPRPSTQPSPVNAFITDDVFQSSFHLSSPESQHKSHGSWELPPLSFEVTRTSLNSGSSITGLVPPATHLLTHHSSLGSVRVADRKSDLIDLATRLVTPAPSVDEDERELLREAGVVAPENNSPKVKGAEATSDAEKEKDNDPDKLQLPDVDFNDSKTKVRRSLHRTLREAHVQTHHRSRKGKDSASSATMTEDALSLTESEGLARREGSFTVHGKKASVITFGSEWQDMAPEERMKLRKSAQSAPGDEDASTKSGGHQNGDARPATATTISTTATTKNGVDFELT